MNSTPSIQLMLAKTPIPTTIVIVLTTNSTRPNENQRRMRFRSLIARESNWPLGHRS